MKTAIRHIVARTYKPWLVKYLSKTRIYKFENISLEIPPQVFHPGFFFSTQMLLNYTRELPLEGRTFLEPGCGSGLISIFAAKKKAIVTATDINPVAIEFLRKNAQRNNTILTIIQSDLFCEIPTQQFDIIAINPPYYKKQPTTDLDYAWFCGENGEYFSSLFEGLGRYMHSESKVLMVLFEGCDMEMLNEMSAQHGFTMKCVRTRKNLLEKDFIYTISRMEKDK